MKTSGRGIVIKEQTVGESDRLVTLLTSDLGIIKAFVRRAKSVNSSAVCSTTLFSYCEFTLYKSKDAYTVANAVPLDIFFNLRKSLENLSLAQYFAQLVLEFGYEDRPSPEMLSLFLNSLYLLCSENPDREKIKAVFEFRSACLGGYMPNIVECNECAKYESSTMYFDTDSALIYCDKCGAGKGLKPLSLGVITAVRYICLSEMKKIFKFKLKKEDMHLLAECAENFVTKRTAYDLSALKFYKDIIKL